MITFRGAVLFTTILYIWITGWRKRFESFGKYTSVGSASHEPAGGRQWGGDDDQSTSR